MAGEPESEAILSREQIEEFTRRLAMLSDDGVERIYQSTYQECRFDGKNLPPPTALQQFVATWRRLRKIRQENQ